MTENERRVERICIIGAGKVGTAMADLLAERGRTVAVVADPDRQARERAALLSGASPTGDIARAVIEADVVLITTPDGAIEETCRLIADAGGDLTGKKFVHMSGALSLAVLDAVAQGGARVLSIHPLQTFADLEGARRTLSGSTFGVTCDPDLEEWAGGFVSDLGGSLKLIPDSDRLLYHAAAVLTSNLITMVKYGALRIARDLGFSDEEYSRAFMPLARATVENVARLGPADALTGPLARGDAATVEAHLTALEEFDPELAALYRAVCLWGLKVVAERGDVSDETIERMRGLLQIKE